MTTKKNGHRSGAAGDAAAAEKPASPVSDDPRVAEEVRRFTEGQQQRIAEDSERNPVLPSLRANPREAARTLLAHRFTKDDVPTLVYHRQTWYRYQDGLWTQLHEDDVTTLLTSNLEDCRQVDANGEVIQFATTQRNVSEVRFQVLHLVTIPSSMAAPCARNPDGSWSAVEGLGLMVCRGLLVDMMTGKTRPTLFTFIPNGAQWTFDERQTECPVWDDFIYQLFGDKNDEVALLQEWFGYVLGGDKWAQKGLIIVGPPRAGKGVIGHVLSHLLGKSMVSSPALLEIGETFGLEDAIDKRLLLISDAKLSTRKDTMAVMEKLLRVVGNDAVNVNRKNKGIVKVELGTRVMMLSNEMPQLPDSSTAINKRFMILRLTESFYGREDVKLLDKLVDELPGIALWAMEGYRRLRDRWKFLEPESSSQERDEWYRGDNPLQRFIDEWCVIDLKAEVTNPALYAAYCEWCEAEGIKRPDPKNTMKKKINMMLGDKIKIKSTTNKAGDDVKVNCGLGLKSKRQF